MAVLSLSVHMQTSHLDVLELDPEQGVKVAAEHGLAVDAPGHKLFRERGISGWAEGPRERALALAHGEAASRVYELVLRQEDGSARRTHTHTDTDTCYTHTDWNLYV